VKKTCLLLAIILAAPAVFAAGVNNPPADLIEQELVPNTRQIKDLQMSKRPVYQTGPGPVSPLPTDPDPGYARGPIAPGSGDMSMGLGSAIVTPRGGAMYSPKQEAGRAIDRVIRQLD
jgi:hypothetical protein